MAAPAFQTSASAAPDAEKHASPPRPSPRPSTTDAPSSSPSTSLPSTSPLYALPPTHPTTPTPKPKPKLKLKRLHLPRTMRPHLPPAAVLLRTSTLGLADGLTVPFALTAGLSTLSSPRVIVLAGLAELFSGALSMGLGAYLAAWGARKAFWVGVRGVERDADADGDGDGDVEREVRRRFAAFGVGSGSRGPLDRGEGEAAGPVSDAKSGATGAAAAAAAAEEEEDAAVTVILRALQRRTRALQQSATKSHRGGDAERVGGDTNNSDGNLKATDDPSFSTLGAFVLEVCRGVERPESSGAGAWVEGLVMGGSYLLGGILPLTPYLILSHTSHPPSSSPSSPSNQVPNQVPNPSLSAPSPSPNPSTPTTSTPTLPTNPPLQHALAISAALTTTILLLFGYFKARVSGCGQRDAVLSAVHTLLVGVAAAGASFGVVWGVGGGA